MLYNNYRRPVLRNEHPGNWLQFLNPSLDLSLPDLSKLIGDEWKKLSEMQKHVRLLTFNPLIDASIRFGKRSQESQDLSTTSRASTLRESKMMVKMLAKHSHQLKVSIDKVTQILISVQRMKLRKLPRSRTVPKHMLQLQSQRFRKKTRAWAHSLLVTMKRKVSKD